MNLHLLHHWLVSMRGGEKVFEQFCKLFPDAPVHTLVHSKNKHALSSTIRSHPINSTFLSSLPDSSTNYKSLLPFFPLAIKNHRVDADFIFSSDAGLIKGMKNVNNAPHVCYCYSPPRYLWDMQDEYLESLPSFKRMIFKKITPYLRRFDQQAADGVDHFIADSEFVRKRIKKVYDREATVIYPAVDLATFSSNQHSEDFYLVVSALVPYKKVELAVRAFNRLEKNLIVIGDGSERESLELLAGEYVELKGTQPLDIVKDHFEQCRALIFPGIEDFGITPLEAQAAGKPVIAFKKGGALETVKDGETGLFFEEQTVESLVETVLKFEDGKLNFSATVCRENAELFSPEKFRAELKNFLVARYPSYFSEYEWGT